MSTLLPGGGGGPRRASAHTSVGFFSSCSKPSCLAQGSPKTDFVFTPITIFHIVNRPGVAGWPGLFHKQLCHTETHGL